MFQLLARASLLIYLIDLPPRLCAILIQKTDDHRFFQYTLTNAWLKFGSENVMDVILTFFETLQKEIRVNRSFIQIIVSGIKIGESIPYLKANSKPGTHNFKKTHFAFIQVLLHLAGLIYERIEKPREILLLIRTLLDFFCAGCLFPLYKFCYDCKQCGCSYRDFTFVKFPFHMFIALLKNNTRLNNEKKCTKQGLIITTH